MYVSEYVRIDLIWFSPGNREIVNDNIRKLNQRHAVNYAKNAILECLALIYIKFNPI